jgi:hypothetical protein
MGRLGPTEWIVILFSFFLVPTLLFLIGYYFGKKSGYLKRVKEENQNK